MKKVFLMMTLVMATTMAMAQESVTDSKHIVATNSFWANWFVQANVAGTSFWGSQENSAMKPGKLLKGYRTNAGLSLAVGKWFTPGIGMRTKMNGFWGRTILSGDATQNANKYWTLNEQVLLNVSNMLMGYDEQRVWNVIPYLGGGIGRNMSYNSYALGLTAGVLNTFRINEKMAVNVDLNYGVYEPDLDGGKGGTGASHALKNKDRCLNLEVGLTYRLGSSTWKGVPDMEAIQALTQSEIDALNAQLADLQAENERLNEELSRQQKQ